MKKQFIILAVAVCVLAFTDAALAQASASGSAVYMSIVGQSGRLEGEVTLKGMEGWHRVYAYSHEIVSPRDAASGLPTGRRQHTPFRIVKLINKSSPQLFNALTKNEVLPTVEVSIWTPSGAGGADVRVLTYRLTNASVASVRPWMPNKFDTSTSTYAPEEEITFTYQTIEITYHNGNITAADDWSTQAKSTVSTTSKP